MPRAIWNGTIVAESETFETVDGNTYFPPEAIRREYFKPSNTTSDCHWKGTANYYTLEVKGEKNVDAAWYYAEPKPAAENIKNHIAFWNGVTVER